MDDLVSRLKIAEDTGRFDKQLTALLRPSLPVVDEISWLRLEREEANMFCGRCEHGSTFVKSNKSSIEWGAVLGEVFAIAAPTAP